MGSLDLVEFITLWEVLQNPEALVLDDLRAAFRFLEDDKEPGYVQSKDLFNLLQGHTPIQEFTATLQSAAKYNRSGGGEAG